MCVCVCSSSRDIYATNAMLSAPVHLLTLPLLLLIFHSLELFKLINESGWACVYKHYKNCQVINLCGAENSEMQKSLLKRQPSVRVSERTNQRTKEQPSEHLFVLWRHIPAMPSNWIKHFLNKINLLFIFFHFHSNPSPRSAPNNDKLCAFVRCNH